MVGQQRILGCLIFCLCFWLLYCGTALAEPESRSELDAGYYIYMGRKPGNAAPRAFTLTQTGKVLWQQGSGGGKANESIPFPPESRSSKSRGSFLPFSGSKAPESRYIKDSDYPVIKWRPLELAAMPPTKVLLTTTYNEKKNGGSVQYIVRLYDAPRVILINVQLQDEDGFKLFEFSVPANKFRRLSDRGTYEAQGELNFIHEGVYKRARQYDVNALNM